MFGFNGECSPQSGFWGLFLFFKLNYMPTIDIPDKICPHCGGTRWFTKIDKHTNKNGVLVEYVSHTCSVIKSEKDKKWASENPEKRKMILKRSRNKVKDTEEYKIKNNERVKIWYKLNKEQAVQNSKNAKIRNPEKYRLLSLHRCRKDTITLHDNYVKALVCQNSELHFKDIPQKLIDIKRKQLLLTRQLKQLQK